LIPSTICSASLICGTHLGLTKEVNSMVLTPVSVRASTREILSVRLMPPFSN